MWGATLIGVMSGAFIAALAAGTVGSLLLALAASIAGALVGAALHWSEPSIYALQMAGPIVLLLSLLLSAAVDRIARHRERRHFS